MDFCYKTATVWQMVGKFLFILKILIPILIIVLGMIDFGKSAISSDDKAMQKSAMSLVKRIIIGIAIVDATPINGFNPITSSCSCISTFCEAL